MVITEKFIKSTLGIAAATVAFSAGTVHAATIYVNAGNTTGIEAGTNVSPFNTIQEGINAAVAGDTVQVAPGIYHGAIELKDAVLVKSEQGPKTTIIDGDGASSVIVLPYAPNPRVTLEGFTVKNGNTLVYLENRYSFWAYSEINISNCIFTNWGYYAIKSMPSAKASVTKSSFYNGGSGYVYDGIWCYGTNFTNATIDKVGNAFNLYQISVTLTNTTLTNASAVAEVWGHYGFGYVYANSSNFYNTTTEGVPGWNGQYPNIIKQNTLAADPLFVNAAQNDYTLHSGSPLIDAGVNVGLPFNGTAPDIGAYEENISIPEMVAALAHSYQAVPLDAYKNAGEQRRNAMNNKFVALLKQINAIKDPMTRDQKQLAWKDALDKLLNDIWAKGDGFFGGNPKNDWITTKEEQTRLHDKVVEIEAEIRAEMAKL